MKIIVEDKFGHEISTTPWVDSNGNVRLVVAEFCPKCIEAREQIKKMINHFDPVEDLLN